MIPKEEEYAYTHQLLQSSEVFIQNYLNGSIAESSLNYLSKSYMAIFESLRDKNYSYFVKGLESMAPTEEGKIIAEATVNLDNKSELKRLEKEFRKGISLLLKKNLENRVILISLTNLVTFSGLLEVVSLKTLSLKLNILTVDILEQINGNRRIGDNSLLLMSKILRQIKEVNLEDFDTTPLENLALEGIVQAFLHNFINSYGSKFGKKTRENLLNLMKIRRLYYLKKLAVECSILNVVDNLKAPTPLLLSIIFLNASILHLLSYDFSISLSKHDAREYVDNTGNFGLNELEMKRKIEKLLTFTPYIGSIKGSISGGLISMLLHNSLVVSLFGWSILFIIMLVNQLLVSNLATSIPHILLVEFVLVVFLTSYDLSIIIESRNKWKDE